MEIPHNPQNFIERRDKTRITCNCLAVVSGQDQQGEKFEEVARVLNLSASGAYLLLEQPVITGGQVHMQIALPIGTPDQETSNRLMTDGIVVRGELHGTGENGIAVRFQRYRFTL